MAKPDESKSGGEESKTSGGRTCRRHPFLSGWFLGLLFGIAIGWWVRPPESFRIDELRDATEQKFLQTKDESKGKLADFAEELARKLRQSGTTAE